MYRPTTSRTFSTNRGSVESWKVSERCGLSPSARQMRPTELLLIPSLSAIERVLQCVAPLGVLSKVATTRASTTSSVILRGAPTRSSSSSPWSRRSANRRLHRLTVSAPMATILATSVSVWPLGAQHHDAGTGSEALRHRSAALVAQQRFALVIGKLNTNTRATRARRISQPPAPIATKGPAPPRHCRRGGVLAPGNLVVRKPLGARHNDGCARATESCHLHAARATRRAACRSVALAVG